MADPVSPGVSQNLLLSGQIVYHGPKEHVLEFFEGLGFQLPHRKGIADFLQARIQHLQKHLEIWSHILLDGMLQALGLLGCCVSCSFI